MNTSFSAIITVKNQSSTNHYILYKCILRVKKLHNFKILTNLANTT